MLHAVSAAWELPCSLSLKKKILCNSISFTKTCLTSCPKYILLYTFLMVMGHKTSIPAGGRFRIYHFQFFDALFFLHHCHTTMHYKAPYAECKEMHNCTRNGTTRSMAYRFIGKLSSLNCPNCWVVLDTKTTSK